MFRAFNAQFIVCAATFFAGLGLSGQLQAAWPDNAFKIKKHDFGTVAVAAKTEFRFPVYNPYTQAMHLKTVRRSCGCTTPIIETATIEPGETGSILARFNTGTFRGKKGATLTVVVDQPFYSEVQLRVDGYIRSDMVFHPGAIDFGATDQGESVSKTSRIYYAGRSDWDIVEVRTNVPWLVPSAKLVSKKGGQAQYDLTVSLADNAPAGTFQNEIVVVTNDSKRPEVPFSVTGIVESPLSVSPQAIALGDVKPGEKIKKVLVLKGVSPFTIDSITCSGWDVSFTKVPEARTTHVIPAFFMPTEAEGDQKVSVEITTSGEQSISATAILTAQIRNQ